LLVAKRSPKDAAANTAAITAANTAASTAANTVVRTQPPITRIHLLSQRHSFGREMGLPRIAFGAESHASSPKQGNSGYSFNLAIPLPIGWCVLEDPAILGVNHTITVNRIRFERGPTAYGLRGRIFPVGLKMRRRVIEAKATTTIKDLGVTSDYAIGIAVTSFRTVLVIAVPQMTVIVVVVIPTIVVLTVVLAIVVIPTVVPATIALLSNRGILQRHKTSGLIGGA
jgi:hypothetical protein